MGSVAAGMVLAWTATIDEGLLGGGLNNIPLKLDDLGWIGSFVTLGAMCICIPIGIICDYIGRKYAMLMLIVPFMIGWLLVIFAENLAMIYAGRFITGIAGGAFCVSAPMYTSEIAEKEIRGALGSYFQLLLTVGILLANILGYTTSIKVYTIICACIPLLFGVVFFLQPETPIYLMKKGKTTEAKAALRKLRGDNYNVDNEIDEIQKNLDDEKKNHIPFLESFKKRATKKSLLICFGLMFFQQMSGVNAVIFYTSNIFKAAGTTIPNGLATIIVGVCQVVATFVSSLVIDKLGRKILLLFSDCVMAVGTLILGLYFTLKDRHVIDPATAEDLGWLPVVALCIFIVVFSLGFGPIPWMISSEVFPPEIKSVASSAAGTFNWLLAFCVTKLYPTMLENIGGDGAFYIFTGFSVVGTIFVFFVIPETKGKTLAEIQDELNGVKTVEGIDNKSYS